MLVIADLPKVTKLIPRVLKLCRTGQCETSLLVGPKRECLERPNDTRNPESCGGFLLVFMRFTADV